ncbi:hypothetical protein, partial [Methylobacterium sp. WL119]|uniref:hypothetical protein n=1 Tax=Methylobacterium sp. WL119 TaxID=2603888 RepID=UPI001AEDFC67
CAVMPQQPRDLADVRESLERIARALDQPVVALFDAEELNARTAETLALTRAFDTIDDRQARARCLAFVTAEAEREARA